MAQVIWTKTAVNLVRGIVEYIGERSPGNADRVRQRLVQAPRILESFPAIGSPVPEFGEQEHIRELLVYSFRLIYVVRREQCYVVYVVRCQRDLASLVTDEELEEIAQEEEGDRGPKSSM